jgi:hypothetical protein
VVAGGFGGRLLPDANLSVDRARCNGDNLWRLPIRARSVIDENDIARAVEADPDYTMRPEVDVTWEAIRS